MKKHLKKTALILLGMMAMLPAFSKPVAAKRTSIVLSAMSGNYWPLIIFIIILVVIIIIKKKLGYDIGTPRGRKKDNYTGLFNSSNTSSSFDPSLTPEENQLLQLYTAEVKTKKPSPMSSTCPNCGAPIKIADATVCPYCRTELTNTNLPKDPDSKKKPIPPEQYNPNRYYEENNTGYQSLDKPSHHNGSVYGQASQNAYGESTYGNANNSYGSSGNSYGGSSYTNPNNTYGGLPFGSSNNTNGGSSYGGASNPYGGSSYGGTNHTYGDSSFGSSDPGSFDGSSFGNSDGSFGSGFASGDSFNDHV